MISQIRSSSSEKGGAILVGLVTTDANGDGHEYVVDDVRVVLNETVDEKENDTSILRALSTEVQVGGDGVEGVTSGLDLLDGLDADITLAMDVLGDVEKVFSEHDLAVESLMLECHLGEEVGVVVSILINANIISELISHEGDVITVGIRLRRVMRVDFILTRWALTARSRVIATMTLNIVRRKDNNKRFEYRAVITYLGLLTTNEITAFYS